ncbi:MAG: Tn3 family transposase [Cyanobacteria bacterium CAN_BIN43]|nr:Tn3 family transposase [Cyanobacteria bacterium CAN_BIN43]
MPVNFLSEVERQRLSQFPEVILESDQIRYFTLTEDDQEQIQRQRRLENRLGFALQLCTLRYLGFCPDDLQQAPSEVVAFLAQQLQIPLESLTHYAQRTQTRTEHLQQIQSYLGFRDPTAEDFKRLAKWQIERAMEHDSMTLLFQLAAEKLFSQKIIRPGVTTLERMVATARRQATLKTYRLLKPLLTHQRRSFLNSLLVADPLVSNTRLNWLRRPATANSPSAILTAIEKIRYLKQQQVHQWDLSELNPNRLKFLARLAKKATNQSLQRAPAERRYPILVAFAQQMLLEITDEAVDLFIRCLAETHGRARRDLQDFRQQAAVTLNDKVILLRQLGQVVLDPAVSDAQVRPDILSCISRERLQQAIEDCDRLIRPLQDESYDFFAHRYSYLRQFAPAFLESLTFRSNRADDPLLQAVALIRQLNGQGKRTVPLDAPMAFVSPQWQPFIHDSEGQIQRRYYELCVLWELRRALRSGNFWLEGSRRYANPETYLIPQAQWTLVRTEVCQMLGIPEVGAQRLSELTTQLNHELVKFTQTVKTNPRVRIEKQQLVLSPLEAESPSETVKALQALVSRRLPLVDLTDLMIEVDQLTRFTQSLVHTGGNASRTSQTQVYLYAAILSQACNLGATTMAQVAELSYRSLLWHTNWYLDDNTLPPAITTLVNYHHRLPLTQAWGGGTLSSSDGQRFPVTLKNAQATALPRYFGYGKGVTFYTWTSDQFSQYGHKVIPSTTRDATYLLDGILDNETDLTILEHTTDTAGYTEVIFALFDMLGLSFAPRIRDVGDQQLYRMKQQVPDAKLKPLFNRRIDQQLILDCWDDMLRVVGSLKRGWITASLLMGKLQSFPEPSRLLQAFQEYGRLVKTIFILRYLNSEDYRRRINRQLNRGESIHSLRRFLMFARQGELRKHKAEELENQSSCLTLVTNSIILWNTIYMAAILDDLKQKGYPVNEEDIAHLSPARFEHINPYGKYRFDVAENQERQGLRPLRPL